MPSHPLARTRPSSTGSNAPASSSTGMSRSAADFFMCATIPNPSTSATPTSATTMSGRSTEMYSTARLPSATATTRTSSCANVSSITRWIVTLSSASRSVFAITRPRRAAARDR
jgi:hypothetical protein